MGGPTGGRLDAHDTTLCGDSMTIFGFDGTTPGLHVAFVYEIMWNCV